MLLIKDALQLQNLDRDIDVPFTIPLKKRELVITDVLRLLPKRRVTGSALFNGREVIAKLFFDKKKAKQHFFRELKGCSILKVRNIPSPNLLFSGQISEDGLYVLLFEKLNKDLDVGDVLRDYQGTQLQRDLLEKLSDLIDKMHSKGLCQTDLHPDNFILHNDKPFVIDVSNIRYTDKPDLLAKKEGLKNLACLLAQIAPFNLSLSHDFYDLYNQKAGRDFCKKEFEKLQALQYAAMQNALKKRILKTLRNATEFVREKSWNYLKLYKRSYQDSEIKAVINDPEVFLKNGEFLKRGNSALLGKVLLTDCDDALVIKQYQYKNLWCILKRSLKTTRAMISWKNANALLFCNLLTPEPIGMVEKRCLFLKKESFYISRYIDGVDLKTFFESNQNQTEKNIVMNEMVQVLMKLKFWKIKHRDMKATNFIFKDHAVYLIDLDGMSFYQGSSKKYAIIYHKMVARFLKNFEKQPELQALFLKRLNDKKEV